MARSLVARGEGDATQLKRIAAAASAVAILSLALALIGWMLAKVAEHPGVPREVGALPSWFAGEPIPRSVGGRPSAPKGAGGAAAPVHEAGTAAASIKPAPAARAPEKITAVQGDYAEFADGKIEIALMEYEMKPGRIRTKPGTVVFVLRNEGRFAHNFHVEGPGIDTTAEKFSPGRTVRLEVTLQEGEYKISCPLSNHDQRGMHGTLLATSRPAGRLTADERR